MMDAKVEFQTGRATKPKDDKHRRELRKMADEAETKYYVLADIMYQQSKDKKYLGKII